MDRSELRPLTGFDVSRLGLLDENELRRHLSDIEAVRELTGEEREIRRQLAVRADRQDLEKDRQEMIEKVKKERRRFPSGKQTHEEPATRENASQRMKTYWKMRKLGKTALAKRIIRGEVDWNDVEVRDVLRSQKNSGV